METLGQSGGQFSKPMNKISNLVDPCSGSNVVDSHQSKIDTYGIHTKSTASDSAIDSKSFYLIGKNRLELPNTDVFIDVARF